MIRYTWTALFVCLSVEYVHIIKDQLYCKFTRHKENNVCVQCIHVSYITFIIKQFKTVPLIHI